jgi:hypothetical protein
LSGRPNAGNRAVDGRGRSCCGYAPGGIGRGLGIAGAKEAQAVYEIADESVDRDHAFFLELAQGNMNGPYTRPWRAEAIEGQIGTLADAHACMAE